MQEWLGRERRDDATELLSAFLLGRRSLYDVQLYLSQLRAAGKDDLATRIERDLILE